MNRRVAAFSIVLIWLSAAGWFVQRQYLRSSSTLLADAALRIPPGATYFALELGGEQIGFASSQIDTLPEALRVQEVMLLEIPALGTVQRIEARTAAELSRTLRLRTFEAVMRQDETRFGARGTVSGDSLLKVELESADGQETMDVPLDGPIVLPAMVPLHVAFGAEPEVGNSYTIALFDPLLLRKRDMEVSIVAESTLIVPDSAALDSVTGLWEPARWDTLHAWQITQKMAGLTVTAWIDELGQVVEATSPAGLTMRRTAFEIAFENFRKREKRTDALVARDRSDVIRQTAIASNVSLATGDLDRLRVRLTGVSLDGLNLDGGRQSLHGDTLTIQREGSEQLRRDPDRFKTETTAAVGAFLRAEPLIQTQDPRIQAQARQIRGRTRNPVEITRKINDWVYENLDKRITVSVTSALQVLESRRGDCNEHTVLYVALARAAGIPARTAAGLVYVDGQFYYHAWPEVYLNGWVAVDPTFGQFPADAAHLRFTIGGLASQVELIRLIGRLELEVVEAGQPDRGTDGQ